MLAADVAKTLVVEGLQGLDSLHIMGAEWLTVKMKELQGPMHTGTYLYYLYEVSKFSRIDVCDVPGRKCKGFSCWHPETC